MKEISKIIYGVWRLENLDENTVYNNLCRLKELGINTIDTADIYHMKEYGDSERLIGKALAMDSSLKSHFKVVTKCGIRINDGKRDIKFYDNTYEYILNQAKSSLENLQIEQIELFLLHRPSVFMDYEEVYRAFKYLKENGLVKSFGVSNYTPIQFDSLFTYLNKRGIQLVTNQIELNPLSIEHLLNENVYYLKGKEISPMVWSPMAGGEIFKEGEVQNTLKSIASKYNVDVMNISIAYLNGMGLDSKIILGSHKIDRYESVMKNLELRLEQSEMFEILEALTKEEVR